MTTHAYYVKHREELLRKNHEWFEKNRAYDNERNRKWRSTHKRHASDFTDDWEHVEGYDRLLAAGLNQFNMKGWHCHHRLEGCGATREELKKYGLYYHRPACELIIMTNSEHCKLHYKLRGVNTKGQFK